MPDDDLLFTSATRLLALLRTREVSAAELVELHLARIASVNPRLNAIVTLTAETARAEAAVADRRLRAGDARPLEGLPVTIKDAFATAGVRTTDGCKLFETLVPDTDAVAVARWKRAGAIVLGKTNVPELSFDFDCDNPVFGRSNNPWDLTRTPGGSSGGEAAAIASGCSPLGLGSDLAGSIRMPSHFCGIAGLKPTGQAVPRTGHLPLGIPPLPLTLMTTVGPMARRVEDLALAYNLIRGPHPSDPDILPSVAADPASVDVGALACAFYVRGGSTPVAAPIQAVVRRAAQALADAGLRVEERVPAALANAHRIFYTLVTADGGNGFRLLAGDRFDDYRLPLRRLIEQTNELPTSAFLLAGMERAALRMEIAELMTEFPVILGPVLPIPAFRHDHQGHDIDGVHVEHLDPLWGTDCVNLTGLPAVAVPAGATPEGLPIGVQVVGRPFAEGEVLAVAAVIERALGGYRRPPLD
ncbi:MAG: amidase [Deltaproteobacteria bacterium]|nr:amidase [Deltaproteobacteria bacterium]